ncbi:unnamed protein product [Prorocentrum cordatum]|uniref:C3H1-type domain-containing protein n=1 Tax=Prorocentrum cordatum TaxID=2364126 RepID=A0ABN9VT75_9DINO|nr:unnamed protein product [Polarella glacialis]
MCCRAQAPCAGAPSASRAGPQHARPKRRAGWAASGLVPAGNLCRQYQFGTCGLGAACPLLHVQPPSGVPGPPGGATPSESSSNRASRASRASPAIQATAIQGSGDDGGSESAWSWTSSSGSRSWADQSEELWGGAQAHAQAAPPFGGGGEVSSAAGRRLVQATRLQTGGSSAGFSGPWASIPAGGGELPVFNNRVSGIPEFIPGVSTLAPSKDAEAQQEPKSKSAARRKQRTMMEKWTEMKARNSATSLPVVEFLSNWKVYAPPPQTRREPRTESASPRRPAAPPASPRKQRQKHEQDPDDSGNEGGFQNTKVSL